MAGFTMDVIASTAFGVDLDTQSDVDHEFVQNAGVFLGVPRKAYPWDNYRSFVSIFLIREYTSWPTSEKRHPLNWLLHCSGN